MKKQKFIIGDHVMIAKDLGPHMGHFPGDCEAIVMYSYDDNFGGGDTDSYSLWLRDHGHISWYHEDQLTLIEHNRGDLQAKWKKEGEN
ncbi:MAG: hypothetical protein JRJ85_02565 [Deltaproteobacteria bacterium]|nr:hypothetical protein [Deltaproteobacteria bacterium]